jgi:transposase
MTYNKPEVVNLDSALSAIQGMTKGGWHTEFAPPYSPDATPAAYESDE